jgi:hypothetical protein
VEEVVKWRAEGIWKGWRKHGEFWRELCGGGSVFGGREVEEKEKRPGRGGPVGFIATHCFGEEREKKRSRAKPRTAGGAGVPAWQPLGSGGPTWNGEGRTAGRGYGGGQG